MVEILIGAVIFMVTLSIDLKTDLDLWSQSKPVNHARGAAIRLIGLIPAVFVSGWLPFHNFPALIFIALFWFFLYWFLFDGIYNEKRAQDWWFTGSEDPDDAKLDNFLQRLTPRQQKQVKIGGAIASLATAIGILIFT